MRIVKVEEEMEQIRFAERAARYFSLHPPAYAYSDGEFSPGSLLALRYGLNSDCVLVLKFDDKFEPTNYQNIIRAKRMDSREGES